VCVSVCVCVCRRTGCDVAEGDETELAGVGVAGDDVERLAAVAEQLLDGYCRGPVASTRRSSPCRNALVAESACTRLIT
jgi:hypothetical protein